MGKFCKNLLSILTSVFLLWGWIFGVVGAQGNNQLFDVNNLPTIKDIYSLDAMIQQLPFVVTRNTSLLVSFHHSAPDTQNIYQIDTQKISDLLSQSQNFDELYQKMRIDIVDFLMSTGYMNFNVQPYQDGNYAIVVQSWDFKFIKNITDHDALDILLEDILSGFKNDFENIKKFGDTLDFKEIGISPKQYSELWTLFMFKNEQDLRDLWYELISWKSRKNVDREYRRHNIMAAFYNIGNVRLILPDETFDLAYEIHYRPNQGDIMYMSGYATFGAGARMVYGGWLCGVATALYQGTLTNLGFQLLEYSAHSTYYRDLFNAEINGTRVSTPGLDATIYSPRYNLQIKNIRNYPIITVFNFGWGESDEELVFTLSKAQDRGSFEFVWKRGMCFTWNINGTNQTNCYDYIKNF